MSGPCRENFNLFKKYGIHNFFRRGIFGDKWARQFVLQDTFGKFVCMILGHSKKTFNYLSEDDYKSVVKVCFRCYKRIKD